MKVDVVVDVGNTRIKWGRCTEECVAEIVSLPPDETNAWQEKLAEWEMQGQRLVWAIAGVHPERIERLRDWLAQTQQVVVLIASHRQLPLTIDLENPDRVGMDRLLNALAIAQRVQRAVPKIAIDAGSAVTVDYIDEENRFRGGAIFPGFRLMAQALHDYTALLPVVKFRSGSPSVPARSTASAIEAGVYWAIAGGIKALIRQMLGRSEAHQRQVFITGGDAYLLSASADFDYIFWPEMTLEGLRLAAAVQPEPSRE